MPLVDFLYLDRDIVRTFLAQIEGGQYDEATERQSASGAKGVGGKVGGSGIGLQLEKSKENSFETEAVVRQVAASEFNRLYAHIAADELVTLDEVSEASVVGEFRRKQFIEVDGRLAVSGTQKMMELISTMGTALPLIEQMGHSTDIDAEMLDGMRAMSALNEGAVTLPAIFTVAGDLDLKVSLELERAHLVKESIEVEATAVLRVQRVLKRDERLLVGDPFGGLTKLLPDEQRKNMLDSLKEDGLAAIGVGDSEIGFPGLVATPIAIYR